MRHPPLPWIITTLLKCSNGNLPVFFSLFLFIIFFAHVQIRRYVPFVRVCVVPAAAAAARRLWLVEGVYFVDKDTVWKSKRFPLPDALFSFARPALAASARFISSCCCCTALPSSCAETHRLSLTATAIAATRCGIFIPSQDVNALFRHFDTQGDGHADAEVKALKCTPKRLRRTSPKLGNNRQPTLYSDRTSEGKKTLK